MTPSPYHSVSDIAQLCRVDRHKVLAWINAGELLARNVATNRQSRPIYRITPADLTAFLDGRATKVPAVQPFKPRRARAGIVKEFV